MDNTHTHTHTQLMLIGRMMKILAHVQIIPPICPPPKLVCTNLGKERWQPTQSQLIQIYSVKY